MDRYDGPPVDEYDGDARRAEAERTSREQDVSHLPPQNLEAEEAAIGAMLVAPSAIRIALELGLVAEDFYRPSHRVIHDAIMACFDEGATDELTVITKLKQSTTTRFERGRAEAALPAAGGAAAVMTLAERVPAVANARAYIEEVQAQAAKRAAVEAGHELARLGYDPTVTPDEVAAGAEQLVHDMVTKAGTKHQRGDAFEGEESIDRWAAAYERALEDPAEYLRRTLSWGQDELDDRLGRMDHGDVFLVSGWTKHGKTWWVMDVVEAVLKQDHRALILSMEMNDEAVTSRFVAMGGHDHDAVREKRIPWSVLQPRLAAMRGWKRRTVQGRTTVSRIRSEVQRARIEGRPFRLVVVDHMGLLRPERGFRGDRRAFVEDACSELKALAEEFELTILLVSQLSRPAPITGCHAEYKRQPVSTDLKEASGLEQIATSIIMVYRHMDKETGRQLADCSARLTFPFHRHKPQPRPLEVEFVPPSKGAPTAYRFLPGASASPQELSKATQTTLEQIAGQFGPDTSIMTPDDIPF